MASMQNTVLPAWEFSFAHFSGGWGSPVPLKLRLFCSRWHVSPNSDFPVIFMLSENSCFTCMGVHFFSNVLILDIFGFSETVKLLLSQFLHRLGVVWRLFGILATSFWMPVACLGCLWALSGFCFVTRGRMGAWLPGSTISREPRSSQSATQYYIR